MQLKKAITSAATTASAMFLAASPAFAQGKAKISDVTVEPGTGFATDIGALLNAVLSFVMVLAALLVFLYLIWGGIEWITSGGDKGKTESARNKITAAVIGLVILAASYAILQLVLRFLGFTGLDDALNNVTTIS